MEKLKLRPGFYKNGTRYAGVGRWIDGDLVRWNNGVLKPIGGWQNRFNFAGNVDMPALWTLSGEAVRSGVLVTDVVAGVNVFLGSNKKIYQVSQSNVATDVTPTTFTAQPMSAAQNIGYGSYRFGFGLYGTPRPLYGSAIPTVFSWGMTEWGFWPVACARGISGLNVYLKKDTDARFLPIANSPTGVFDVLVTDERFLMTFGQDTDYRLVRWSDRENYDVWAEDVSNEAGQQRLAGKGKLLRGISVVNQILILGENDAFSGRYVGPPYVHGFNRVGSNCGIIGPQAVAVAEGFAMWLGDKSFWLYDGTLSKVPCEVMDFYLADHNRQQRSKTHAFTLSEFDELWWLYQSNSSPTGDVDSYLIYNWVMKCWYTGRIDRTFAMDSGVLSYPMMVAKDGKLYDHEVGGAQRGDSVAFIESGPLEVANGEMLWAIANVLPDAKFRGDVNMRLSVRNHADEIAPIHFRDFVLTNPTSTTGIQGRDIRMRLSDARVNPDWVIGDFRIETPVIRGPRR